MRSNLRRRVVLRPFNWPVEILQDPNHRLKRIGLGQPLRLPSLGLTLGQNAICQRSSGTPARISDSQPRRAEVRLGPRAFQMLTQLGHPLLPRLSRGRLQSLGTTNSTKSRTPTPADFDSIRPRPPLGSAHLPPFRHPLVQHLVHASLCSQPPTASTTRVCFWRHDHPWSSNQGGKVKP